LFELVNEMFPVALKCVLGELIYFNARENLPQTTSVDLVYENKRW
jgi:hypothetical protein